MDYDMFQQTKNLSEVDSVINVIAEGVDASQCRVVALKGVETST